MNVVMRLFQILLFNSWFHLRQLICLRPGFGAKCVLKTKQQNQLEAAVDLWSWPSKVKLDFKAH